MPGAVGYNIRFGIRPDRLTLTHQLWADELGNGATLEKELRSLNAGVPYWVAVEAFNESGVSKLSRVVPDPLAEPAAGEAGALQAAADRRHPAHVAPHEIVAVVGGLKQDRSLVDAEIVLRDPAVLADRPSRVSSFASVVGEAGVEAVLEAVAVEQRRAASSALRRRG